MNDTQPWTADPEGDRRFMEAVQRIDLALQHPVPKRERRRITVRKRRPVPHYAPAKARHAHRAARPALTIPLWPVLLVLAVQMAILAGVLL